MVLYAHKHLKIHFWGNEVGRHHFYPEIKNHICWALSYCCSTGVKYLGQLANVLATIELLLFFLNSHKKKSIHVLFTGL